MGIPRLGTVSTHASVKDATPLSDRRIEPFVVSTHASVKDATFAERYELHSGCVSTHASVKDATANLLSYPTKFTCFYPRVREGRDIPAAIARFIGGRFYPRVREGRDVFNVAGALCLGVFLPTRP